ncbi:MAG: hypothetical protein ACKVPZ_05105 [Burkholderiaceae bacterium]
MLIITNHYPPSVSGQLDKNRADIGAGMRQVGRVSGEDKTGNQIVRTRPSSGVATSTDDLQ